MRSLAFAALLCAALCSAVPAPADGDALPLSAAEVAARWHGRLARRHFNARVRMHMDLGGLREERRLRVFRDDEDGRGERVLVRFDAPADLRNVGLLYLAHADRPNDYFLYQPEIRRIRRLPQSVANDDVYGIDLEFLGFGVAQTVPTTLESLTREKLGGRSVWKLVESAREPNPRFETRRTWIDPASWAPLRTEHLRGARVVLVAETLELAEVQGVATPRRVRFAKPIEKREVQLEVDSVDYEAPIPEEYFSALALLRAATPE
ncbi:MAG TPA: outer membrane lipoprotein-sorting protein [Myxococcota bacterium]|nr:outer membrane lipoprotein-sorting protein [Myxococcota bacterium]